MLFGSFFITSPIRTQFSVKFFPLPYFQLSYFGDDNEIPEQGSETWECKYFRVPILTEQLLIYSNRTYLLMVGELYRVVLLYIVMFTAVVNASMPPVYF